MLFKKITSVVFLLCLSLEALSQTRELKEWCIATSRQNDDLRLDNRRKDAIINSQDTIIETRGIRIAALNDIVAGYHVLDSASREVLRVSKIESSKKDGIIKHLKKTILKERVGFGAILLVILIATL